MTATAHALTYALIDSLKDHLQDKLIDNVPAGAITTMLTYTDKNSVSRVFMPSLVKIGQLQQDPTTLPSSSVIPSGHVTIHFQDPADEADGWKDSLASPVDSMTNAGHRFPSIFELPAGEMWWRRFTLDWAVYFTTSDHTQTEAARIGAAFKHLLERYCSSHNSLNEHGWQCASLTDPLGETSLHSQVVKSHCWESGGPPDDYIYRGGTWVQVKSNKAY